MGNPGKNKGIVQISTFILVLLIDSCLGLDLESAKEQSCFEIKDTVSPDTAWVESVKFWYYPLMPRFDLYRWAIDLTKTDPDLISENDLYYKSCITWKYIKGGFEAEGFGGKKAMYESNSTGNGFDKYEFWPKEGEGNGGSCAITLTDNATFLVSVCCLTGDQMVWEASFTTKTPSPEAIKTVHDHVESLGFKRKYFTGLRYETCETMQT